MSKRYEVTEKDGTKHEHDDINRATQYGKDGATIKDRQTGNEYQVRK